MKRVKVTCTGITPLLMNRFQDLPRGCGGRPQSPLQQAAAKLYKDGRDRCAIPTPHFYNALAQAGRIVKIGRRRVSTATKSIPHQLLRIQDDFLPLKNKPTWVVDRSRAVMRLGRKSHAIELIRPRFDSWSFDVEIEYNPRRIDEKTLRQLVDAAGMLVGVGDMRPGLRLMIPALTHGRFKVATWRKVSSRIPGTRR